jgi:hypothetical protein
MDRQKRPILILSALAIVLLLTASLTGILSDDGGRPSRFTSLSGEQVDIYGGTGIYQNDNIYKAVIFRGFDWVSLLVVAPLFLLGSYAYRSGQLRGRLILAALFMYLAYIYLIGVMGNAFNILFLVWTALFSIGGFGLSLVLSDLDISALPEKLGRHFPRKSASIYIVVVGLILLFQYLAEILSAYAAGSPPASLDQYTTLELAALELGIMIPLHLIGGTSLWKRKAIGYILVTLLAFASAMVFLALSISLWMNYASFGKGDPLDMGITTAITLVTLGFAFVIFRQIRET